MRTEACSCNFISEYFIAHLCEQVKLIWLMCEIYASAALEALKVIENSTVALGKLVIVTRFSDEINLTMLLLLCPTLIVIYCFIGPVMTVHNFGTEHI